MPRCWVFESAKQVTFPLHGKLYSRGRRELAMNKYINADDFLMMISTPNNSLREMEWRVTGWRWNTDSGGEVRKMSLYW